MKNPPPSSHELYPDTHHDVYSKTVFGFWIYLLTDFVFFGTLFASYAVLFTHTFGGPSSEDLFTLRFSMTQTFILLTSSLTAGLAGASAHRREKNWTILYFILTFFLGLAFIAMELSEFHHLISCDCSWMRSAFLSSYFTLVGTHGVHVILAMLWVIILIIPVWREGITHVSLRRLTCLKMFWQFLNIIWVFIFSFVYLIGVRV
jgi:cytochrome o ubiquinol oxidase subunit III